MRGRERSGGPAGRRDARGRWRACGRALQLRSCLPCLPACLPACCNSPLAARHQQRQQPGLPVCSWQSWPPPSLGTAPAWWKAAPRGKHSSRAGSAPPGTRRRSPSREARVGRWLAVQPLSRSSRSGMSSILQQRHGWWESIGDELQGPGRLLSNCCRTASAQPCLPLPPETASFRLRQRLLPPAAPRPPGRPPGHALARLLGAAEDEHAVPALHRLPRQQCHVVAVLYRWQGREQQWRMQGMGYNRQARRRACACHR